MRRPAAFLALLASLAAAAAPSLELVPARVKPGDPVLVVVRGAEGVPEGTIGSRPARFYAHGQDAEALVGIPVEEEPGILQVRVTAGAIPLGARLEVIPPEFPERNLTVAKKFVRIPPSARARIKSDQAAYQKAWATPFHPRAFGDNFQKPREAEITAHFGDKRTLNGKKTTQHYGLDLDGSIGDEIRAANDGRVVMVRDCYLSGNTVLVDHGAGLVTAYFHLSKFLVTAGEEIRRGELLGLVGKTGRVTGPHLHFGAHIGTLWVNPQALLALSFPGAVSPPPTFPPPEPPDGGTPDGGMGSVRSSLDGGAAPPTGQAR
ncbi:MAG TPA: M23 family metallopeptidase [Myxococcaceae bacterium]|nr:M23 family metallopeptidase [Myxococcaceae bacterium]